LALLILGPAVFRVLAQRRFLALSQFFAGLELLEPGVVQVHWWRPEVWDLGTGRNLAIYAGVGRKN
jgi:S-adenosyl methyltransferase